MQNVYFINCIQFDSSFFFFASYYFVFTIAVTNLQCRMQLYRPFRVLVDNYSVNYKEIILRVSGYIIRIRATGIFFSAHFRFHVHGCDSICNQE